MEVPLIHARRGQGVRCLCCAQNGEVHIGLQENRRGETVPHQKLHRIFNQEIALER